MTLRRLSPYDTLSSSRGPTRPVRLKIPGFVITHPNIELLIDFCVCMVLCFFGHPKPVLPIFHAILIIIFRYCNKLEA